jgi:hypothetical protein
VAELATFSLGDRVVEGPYVGTVVDVNHPLYLVVWDDFPDQRYMLHAEALAPHIGRLTEESDA